MLSSAPGFPVPEKCLGHRVHLNICWLNEQGAMREACQVFQWGVAGAGQACGVGQLEEGPVPKEA